MGVPRCPIPARGAYPPPPTLILVDTRNGLPRTSMTFDCNGIRCPCRHDVATSLHEGASPRTRWMQSEAVHFSSPLWHHIPRTAALRLNTRRSGRQDSNLRSPAPKAGALATTLRPVSSRLAQQEHQQPSGTPRRSANGTPHHIAISSLQHRLDCIRDNVRAVQHHEVVGVFHHDEVGPEHWGQTFVTIQLLLLA